MQMEQRTRRLHVLQLLFAMLLGHIQLAVPFPSTALSRWVALEGKLGVQPWTCDLPLYRPVQQLQVLAVAAMALFLALCTSSSA